LTPCEPAASSEYPGKAAHNNRSTNIQYTQEFSRVLACHYEQTVAALDVTELYFNDQKYQINNIQHT